MTSDGTKAVAQKLPRPHQVKDLTPDQMIAVILRLAMEISVLRDRLSTHETLLARQGALRRDDVERFVPGAEEAKRRADASTQLIEDIVKDLSSL